MCQPECEFHVSYANEREDPSAWHTRLIYSTQRPAMVIFISGSLSSAELSTVNYTLRVIKSNLGQILILNWQKKLVLQNVAHG